MKKWDNVRWQIKEAWLTRYGFKPGWSSHTWRTLPRDVQALWEVTH